MEQTIGNQQDTSSGVLSVRSAPR